MTGAVHDARQTLGDAVDAATQRLAAAGVESPRRDARLLVGLVAGVDGATVLGYPERPLGAAARAVLADLVRRRVAREPVSRLVGRREFWSLDFALAAATLDPRPDSETLIAAALDHLPDRAAMLRVLDLGTGSGCLVLALLSELPRATGFGIDVVPAAVHAARRNAVALGLASRAFFAVSSWASAISGEFDVILANPPYIPTGEIAALAPEVAHYEPRLALDGGGDGLDGYRALAPAVGRLLTRRGLAVVEIGAGQATPVTALFAAAGLATRETRRDLGGIARCLVLARM